MPATKNINIRVAPERKQALQEMAQAFGESVTEFVMKSVYMRVQAETPVAGKADPFVLAMRAVSGSRGKALNAEERESVASSRQARKAGGQTISLAEARKRLLA
jgi:hypothetical protein